MGRPRKPTALKILEGAQPCRINRDEPRPPKGIGEPPGYLDDDARKAWARIGRQLDDMGLLTVADADSVGLYCEAYSRWLEANKAVRKEGLTVTGRFGPKVNPNVQIADACHAQMVKLLTQFGMTPAARSSLHVGAKAEEDPLLAFLALKSTHGQSQKAKA